MTSRQDAPSDLSTKLRLFIGVALPQDVCKVLAAKQATWQSRVPAAKWVPQEDFHVTLQFLGSCSSKQVPQIEGAMQAAAKACSAFQVGLNRWGTFSLGQGRGVLWAGFGKGADGLGQLAKRLAIELAKREFKLESRDYVPHVTLCRSWPEEHRDSIFIDEDKTFQENSWRVEGIALYRSNSDREGARYDVLYEQPLANITQT